MICFNVFLIQPAASNQFGVPLASLVPPGVVKVPPILEKCFQYLENQGVYILYRTSDLLTLVN